MRKVHITRDFHLIVAVPQFPPSATVRAIRDRSLRGQPVRIAFQSAEVLDETDAAGTASDGLSRPALTVLPCSCRLACHRWTHPLAVAPASLSAWPLRVPPPQVSADPPRQAGRRSATRENRSPIPPPSPAVPDPAPHSACGPARPPATAGPNCEEPVRGPGRPLPAVRPRHALHSHCAAARAVHAPQVVHEEGRQARHRHEPEAARRQAVVGRSPLAAAATRLRERTLRPEGETRC